MMISGWIKSGSCVARVSANLLLSITDWTLTAFLVDEVFSELLLLYRLSGVFLCRRRKSEWGRWSARGERQVRQPRMRHVTPDNKIVFWSTKDEMQIALGPSAKAHDCAVLRCMCSVDGCTVHTPRRFSGGLSPGNRNYLRLRRKNTTNRQILKNASNPNLFSIESRTIVTMKTTLPPDFPAAVYSTAIQSSDQQKSRSVHSLRTVVLVFDELVGWDGWVFHYAGFPPSARLVIAGIILLLWRILVAVWEVEAHQHSNKEPSV